MKIRTKLIVNYSALSIALLFVFSFIVIFSYIRYRQYDFKNRLHNRAVSIVNMLMIENAIDSSILQLIDKNTVSAMGKFQITIYGKKNKIVYTSAVDPDEKQLNYHSNILSKFIEQLTLKNKQISFVYSHNKNIYLIKASAIDVYGASELQSLLFIITWVLFFSLLLIIAFGFYNARWSLKPFKKIINEVDEIDPTHIKKRVSVHGNDEISQLATKFNTLLDRIEHAFETEKSFISNASHELRTPVTSVLGQIEVVLNKSRDEEEYKAILQSVYEDTTQMATIINGFLDLAEANLANNQIAMQSVRVDELIFAIVDDFEKTNPQYNIAVDFVSYPENDIQIECLANERLLCLMFKNIIDNACKYSGDNKAKVTIDFTNFEIVVSIIDNGIGIPNADIENIFKPLYRGRNTSGKLGHGIGLAIVKRIADLHHARINISSEQNIGTTITVHIKI